MRVPEGWLRVALAAGGVLLVVLGTGLLVRVLGGDAADSPGANGTEPTMAAAGPGADSGERSTDDEAQAAPSPAASVPPDSDKVTIASPAQRAPRLPLPAGSLQQDVVPPNVDITTSSFVYAGTPVSPEELLAELVSKLPAAGWKIEDQSAANDGTELTVIAPDGSHGVLVVSATPPGVPGFKSQVMGPLTRPGTLPPPPPAPGAVSGSSSASPTASPTAPPA